MVHFRFEEVAQTPPVSAKVQRQLKGFASLLDFQISVFFHLSILIFLVQNRLCRNEKWMCLIRHYKKERVHISNWCFFPLDTCQRWWKLIFASNKFFLSQFCPRNLLKSVSNMYFKIWFSCQYSVPVFQIWDIWENLWKLSIFAFTFKCCWRVLLWERMAKNWIPFFCNLGGELSKEFAIWVFRIYINSHFWQAAQNWDA